MATEEVEGQESVTPGARLAQGSRAGRFVSVGRSDIKETESRLHGRLHRDPLELLYGRQSGEGTEPARVELRLLPVRRDPKV